MYFFPVSINWLLKRRGKPAFPPVEVSYFVCPSPFPPFPERNDNSLEILMTFSYHHPNLSVINYLSPVDYLICKASMLLLSIISLPTQGYMDCVLWACLHRYIWFMVILSIISLPGIYGLCIMGLPTQVYMVHSHIVHYGPAYTGIYGSWSYYGPAYTGIYGSWSYRPL